MPTRKQKRRELKSKRHEYEFVYLDSEGNEVDEPEEADAPATEASTTNGSKPKSAAKKAATQSGRPRREPQAPSWKRAAKRSALLGVFVMIFFSFTAKGNLIRVLPTALLFSVAYVPVMYYIDRMAYRRFQGRGAAKTTTTKGPAAKKR